MRAGVVVIGGGAFGASSFYHLVARGIPDVVLLEQATLGSGSTGRSAAVVETQYLAPDQVALCGWSMRVFQWLEREHALPFVHHGSDGPPAAASSRAGIYQALGGGGVGVQVSPTVGAMVAADAAGLPILPGLVRYEEVASGEIRHALRFTAPVTQKRHVWPARHDASSNTSATVPPMGQRFRLKASFDISAYPPAVQVILTALMRYGMILADNGSAWFLSGVPDPRWDDDELVGWLQRVPGSAFEAVDMSALMVDPNSGRAAGAPGVPAAPTALTVSMLGTAP